MSFRLRSVRVQNRDQVERLIATAAARRVLQSAPVVEQALQSEMRDQIKANFITDRPTARRRTPGSPRLINSFEAVSESTGGEFPITVTLQPVARIRNNEEEQKKINSLIYGSREHWIRAGGGKLKFPWLKPGTRGGPYAMGSEGRRFHAYTVKPNVAARSVWHPGTPKTDILEKAGRNVARRMRSLIR